MFKNKLLEDEQGWVDTCRICKKQPRIGFERPGSRGKPCESRQWIPDTGIVIGPIRAHRWPYSCYSLRHGTLSGETVHKSSPCWSSSWLLSCSEEKLSIAFLPQETKRLKN